MSQSTPKPVSKLSRLGAVPLAQILQAGVNFLFLMAAARTVSPDVFAIISITWIWYIAMLMMKRTLIGEQIVVASARTQSAFRVRELMFSAGLAVAAAFIAPTMAVGLAFDGPAALYLVALSGSAMIVNDSLRFAAIASGHYTRLLRADSFSVATMGLGFAVTFSAVGSAWVLAVPILSSPITIWMLRGLVKPSLNQLKRYVESMGTYATWATVQVLLTNVASQGLILLALPALDGREFAALRALQSAISPLSTPAGAIQPLLFRRFSRTRPTRHRLLGSMRWGIASLCLSGGVGLLLTLAGELWIPILLGAGYVEYSFLSLPVALTLGIVYVGLPTATWLRLLRLGREIAIAQFAAILVAVVAVPIASVQYGVLGAAWALLVHAAISAAVAFVLLWRRLGVRKECV